MVPTRRLGCTSAIVHLKLTVPCQGCFRLATNFMPQRPVCTPVIVYASNGRFLIMWLRRCAAQFRERIQVYLTAFKTYDYADDETVVEELSKIHNLQLSRVLPCLLAK